MSTITTLASAEPAAATYSGAGILVNSAREIWVDITMIGMAGASSLVLRVYFAIGDRWHDHSDGDLAVTATADGRRGLAFSVPEQASHLCLRKISGAGTPTEILYHFGRGQ